MKKKFAALLLGGLMLCTLGVQALAAGDPIKAVPISADLGGENAQILPDSCLYYGQVKAIRTDEDGTVTALHMDSERSGEYVMNVSDKTFWIDSGARTPADPADVAVGEGLYVFHSPVSTRSMPPQSAAFAVVRNVPQDAGCAMYHKVEDVALKDGKLTITTDRGGLLLLADGETGLSSYRGGPVAGLEDIQAGSYIMAWYGVVAQSYPGQAHPAHIMILDRELLTRAGLVALLHEAAGSPVVNYAMNYSDLSQSDPYVEAIRWASSEKLVCGYEDGRFGPEEAASREQLVAVLWRRAGSPMLMDYPGLADYSDAGDISPFAQPALAWAHQKGLLPTGSRLGPKDAVTLAEAETMLAALG